MTPSSWVVNLITEDDLEDVSLIDRQSPSPWTPAQLEGDIFDQPGWQLAGREKNIPKLKGFLLARDFAGEAEILRLAVGNCHLRQGLATQLLQCFSEILANKGITTCHLELRGNNLPARKLYEKLDFVMTGLRKKYYTDPADDAVLMTRNI